MQGTGFSRWAARRPTPSRPTSFPHRTSEVALVSLHPTHPRGGAASGRYAGLSTCFRREAGAHGKDVRGVYGCISSPRWSRWSSAYPMKKWRKKSTTGCWTMRRRCWRRWRSPTGWPWLHGRDRLGRRAKHEVDPGCPGATPTPRPTPARPWRLQSRRSNIRLRRATARWSILHLNNTRWASPRILIRCWRTIRTRTFDHPAEGPGALHERLTVLAPKKARRPVFHRLKRAGKLVSPSRPARCAW